MKLYEAKRNSWVMPIDDTTAPPDARPVSVGESVLFHHLDGMYSYCHDMNGQVVHLPAWQEVVYAEEPSSSCGCRNNNQEQREPIHKGQPTCCGGSVGLGDKCQDVVLE